MLAYSGAKIPSHFYPGDLVTRTVAWEIRSVSGRLPDYPGELACMHLTWEHFVSLNLISTKQPSFRKISLSIECAEVIATDLEKVKILLF